MRLKNKRFIEMICMLLMCAFLFAGCSGLMSRWDNTNEIIDQQAINIEDILNNAIDKLSSNANNWESILRGTIDQIPDAERQVRADIENLLNGSIGAAGVEFRCDMDFMGRRILERIRGIKAAFLKQPVPERTPVICSLAPSAVDMNLAVNNRNKIEIFGYNFDTQGITLQLQDGTVVKDVTRYIYRNSEYKMIINLGFNGVNLNDKSKSIKLKYKNSAIMNIPVIQAYPEVCQTMEKSVELNNMQIYPKKYKGDSEWGGHGPCVNASFRIWVTSDKSKIMSRLYARMWECNSNLSQRNDSIARGDTTSVLYIAPVGKRIEKINSPTTSSLSGIYTGKDNHTHTKIAGDALVKEWVIQGDTRGGDVGESNVMANLNPINVVLREKDDCVTEEELAALIEANQIQVDTVKTLIKFNPVIMQTVKPVKGFVKK